MTRRASALMPSGGSCRSSKPQKVIRKRTIVRRVEGIIETPKPAKVTLPTPTEKAKNMMSFTAWMNASEENRKKIQDGARHEFINKMYAELLHDYTVCQIEGWDMFEFPRMLRDALSVCFPKEPKQLSLF